MFGQGKKIFGQGNQGKVRENFFHELDGHPENFNKVLRESGK